MFLRMKWCCVLYVPMKKILVQDGKKAHKMQTLDLYIIEFNYTSMNISPS